MFDNVLHNFGRDFGGYAWFISQGQHDLSILFGLLRVFSDIILLPARAIMVLALSLIVCLLF
jgi:hypothetical protein